MGASTDQAGQRDLMASLERLELKLDMILLALTRDEEDPEGRTLDGEPAGNAREEGTPL